MPLSDLGFTIAMALVGLFLGVTYFVLKRTKVGAGLFVAAALILLVFANR